MFYLFDKETLCEIFKRLINCIDFAYNKINRMDIVVSIFSSIVSLIIMIWGVTILKSIKENVITNMPGTEMIKYGLKMISNSGTSMNTLQGYNERIYGQDFLVADSSYNRSIIESLKITSEADNSEEKKNSSIMVLNATRVNGLAGNLKTELEKLGYATISTGNYEKSKESSILSNNKDLRKLLSEDTGIKNLSKNKESEYQDYDAVIIIGEDYLEFR